MPYRIRPFFGGKMFFKRLSVLPALVFLVAVAGCAGLTARQAVDRDETVIARDVAHHKPADRPQSVIMNDKIASLFFDKEGMAVFTMDGKRLELDGDLEDKGNGDALSLFKDDKYLYAVWHLNVRKNGSRLLYFRASYDGGKTFSPAKLINSDNGAMNYTFASNGKGLLVFAYDDMRHGQYEIYCNISHDYGKTWLEKDVRLDSVEAGARSANEPKAGTFAIEPRVTVNDQTILVLWKERHGSGAGPAYFNKTRTSLDGGKTWSDEAVVRKDNTSYVLSDSPAIHDGSFYAFGVHVDDGVVGFRSVDNGQTWQPLGAVPGTASKQCNPLRIVESGDFLYAVYSQGGSSNTPDRSIPELWFATLSFSDNKWNDPVRLDRREFNVTSMSNPVLNVLKDGTVVSAWQDNRDIAPNIYMTFSHDKGKTWLERDIAVNEPGKYSSELPNFLPGKDDMSITYLKYSDYGGSHADYIYRDISMKEGAITGVSTVKGPSAQEKAEKLRQRVEEFWNYRVLAKFPETYTFYDPAYRNQETLHTYLRYQGNIIYHGFNIKDISIQGNVAYLTVGYNFEVKEMQALGQKIVIPPKDDVLFEAWVWIYDNWYKVYKTTFGDQIMKY